MQQKQTDQVCDSCGYHRGTNHETWCPSLHPHKWSWMITAHAPETQEEFYKEIAKDAKRLIKLFKIWMLHEEEFSVIGTGTFTIDVFHLHCGIAKRYTRYTISFAKGRSKEMWGSDRAQPEVQHAWEKAGGTYRK